MKHLLSMLVVVGLFTATGFATIIEDFEDVSDWSAYVSADAISGSITTNSGEAQVDTYAGELAYSHGTSAIPNVVSITKTLDTVIDLTNQTIELHLKQPNDPNAYLQLYFYEGTNSSNFAFYEFPEGTGEWEEFSIPISSFSDYGTNPDLADIKWVRFQSLSKTTTAGSYFIDQLAFVPEPVSMAILGIGSVCLLIKRRRA